MKSCLTRGFLWGLLVLLLASQPGCGLLVSQERQIDRFRNNLQVATNNNDWKKCATFFQPGAKYYAFNSTTPQNVSVFFRTLSAMSLRTAFFIQVKDLKKINEKKYVMTVQFQQRTGNNTSTINYFWDATFIWVLVGEEWRVEELKETSAQRMAKA
jgi:hypothetical protein